MIKPIHLTILGGGPAGLAVGYYARKNELEFKIYESKNRIGGNCITLKHKDFLFDSGAHRFHDKDEEVTKEIKFLLGEELKKINAPSQIYYKGKLIDFPLSPLNLIKNLGLVDFTKASFKLLKARFTYRENEENFKSLALRKYGKVIAESFLLNYSEKLWGLPCDELSPSISGKRLKGLNLNTFLKELILGRTAKTEHLDGSFYYPKRGYGTIVEEIGKFCGYENIVLNSSVSKICHNTKKITEIQINGKEIIEIDKVISTLPLKFLLQILEPRPPKHILKLAKTLRYRNLLLVTLFFKKESITPNASVYFPEPDFIFTRVYEPKNRSIYMSPPGKTSLVVEIPCQQEDDIWNLKIEEVIDLIKFKLIQIGWIKEEEVIDVWAGKLSHAYPILEIGYEDKIQEILDWIKNFNNLKISGRNGKFAYTHLHDMLIFGKEIIEEYIL